MEHSVFFLGFSGTIQYQLVWDDVIYKMLSLPISLNLFFYRSFCHLQAAPKAAALPEAPVSPRRGSSIKAVATAVAVAVKRLG